LHCELESNASDAFAARAGNAAQGDGDVLGHHHLAASRFHVAVGIEAFGVFTSDYEIEFSTAKREARIGARWPDIGEQIEALSEHHRRIAPPLCPGLEFKGRGWTEHDPVGFARLFDDVGMDRMSVHTEAGVSRRRLLDSQTQIEAVGRGTQESNHAGGELWT